MKFLIAAFVFICFCCRSTTESTIRFRETSLTPDSLFQFVTTKTTIDPTFQFYFEKRDNSVRIIIEDSVIFNLRSVFSKYPKIQFLNQVGKQTFSNYVERAYRGDLSNALDGIASQLRNYLINGVYSIGKGANFLVVQTAFEDSSYTEIESRTPGFIDEHYKTVKKNYPKIEFHYCLGFYKITGNRDSVIISIAKNGRLIRRISDTIFYFREPIPPF